LRRFGALLFFGIVFAPFVVCRFGAARFVVARLLIFRFGAVRFLAVASFRRTRFLGFARFFLRRDGLIKSISFIR